MKLIMLGSIGAGKGTQAKVLSDKLNIPHISTGDIFRKNIKDETEIGKKVKSVLDSGGYVDDELTTEIVALRLKEEDCSKGFILDGFPRNEIQAASLEKIATPDKVLYINVLKDVIIKRLSGRISCKECGLMYHKEDKKPRVENICDVCSHALLQRADDKEDVIVKRFAIFEEQTAPLIYFYKSRNCLVEVDGNGDVDMISDRILREVYGSDHH